MVVKMFFLCSSTNKMFILVMLTSILLHNVPAVFSEEHLLSVDDKVTERVQRDYPFNPYGGSAYGLNQPGMGMFGGNGYGSAMDTLARNMLPVNSDVNSGAQQQIQQLQEQVRKLQEQINRSQQGKSSFEQFAQMLATADGLDCNCSGTSGSFPGFQGGGMGGSQFGSSSRFGGGPGNGGGYGGYNGGFGGQHGGGGGSGMMPPFSSSMGGAGRFPGQFAPGQLYPPIKA